MTLTCIRSKQPLVHCITNHVVMNFTANGLLAVGASPIMAHAVEEVAHITSISNALLINIGTLDAPVVHAMDEAMRAANAHHIPVVLDPVGAGASPYRLETVRTFLTTHRVTLIRGNAGELAAIAGITWHATGVDCGSGEANVAEIAEIVARMYNCLVIVTGAEDVLTDGQHTRHIAGGCARITRITGSGCLLSALCAAVLGASENAFADLATLLQAYKEAAVRANAAIGTYPVQLLNELERLAEVRV